MSTPSQ